MPEGRRHRGRRVSRGALAAAIVARHPVARADAVTARSEAGRRHDELYPRYRVPLVLEDSTPTDRRARRRAFVAYPHGAAAPAVKALRERGLKVVDLSADFRLDRERYERYYQPHEAPELLGEAVYGLTELHRDEIRGAELVAAPGCYPTAAMLALWPLRDTCATRSSTRSRASPAPAARPPRPPTSCRSTENVSAYKVEGHRHRAELEQELGSAPLHVHAASRPGGQGLLASCYVTSASAKPRSRPVPRRLRGRAVRGPGRRAARHRRRARDQPLPHPRRRSAAER